MISGRQLILFPFQPHCNILRRMMILDLKLQEQDLTWLCRICRIRGSTAGIHPQPRLLRFRSFRSGIPAPVRFPPIHFANSGNLCPDRPRLFRPDPITVSRLFNLERITALRRQYNLRRSQCLPDFLQDLPLHFCASAACFPVFRASASRFPAFRASGFRFILLRRPNRPINQRHLMIRKIQLLICIFRNYPVRHISRRSRTLIFINIPPIPPSHKLISWDFFV